MYVRDAQSCCGVGELTGEATSVAAVHKLMRNSEKRFFVYYGINARTNRVLVAAGFTVRSIFTNPTTGNRIHVLTYNGVPPAPRKKLVKKPVEKLVRRYTAAGKPVARRSTKRAP